MTDQADGKLIQFPQSQQTTFLTHFDRAREELELASTIDEVKSIRDKAEALRLYAKQARLSLDMQNRCAEIKIRAERRAGEMLQEREKHPPGPPREDRSHDGTYPPPPRLEDLGITKNQSSRWQLIASIPEEDFDARVESIKRNEKELTSSEMLSLAGYLQRERNRQERREQAAEAATSLEADERIQIRHGDFREVLADIPDDSVQLVLTDPVYLKENLPAWSELSAFAARVLKSGRLLAAYSGNYYLFDCMKALATHLQYVWTCSVVYRAFPDTIFKHRIKTYWKPILLFSKGDYQPEQKVPWMHDLIEGDGVTKENHRWEQGIGEACHLIDGLTYEGDLVVDPFLGSGTVAVSCKRLGRRFVGCDEDDAAVNTALSRLAQEPR